MLQYSKTEVVFFLLLQVIFANSLKVDDVYHHVVSDVAKQINAQPTIRTGNSDLDAALKASNYLASIAQNVPVPPVQAASAAYQMAHAGVVASQNSHGDPRAIAKGVLDAGLNAGVNSIPGPARLLLTQPTGVSTIHVPTPQLVPSVQRSSVPAVQLHQVTVQSTKPTTTNQPQTVTNSVTITKPTINSAGLPAVQLHQVRTQTVPQTGSTQQQTVTKTITLQPHPIPVANPLRAPVQIPPQYYSTAQVPYIPTGPLYRGLY